jgi:hypothetical protein
MIPSILLDRGGVAAGEQAMASACGRSGDCAVTCNQGIIWYEFALALDNRWLAATPARTIGSEMPPGCRWGPAARQAHLAFRAAGDPTWLAYTVLADPFARVDRG